MSAAAVPKPSVDEITALASLLAIGDEMFAAEFGNGAGNTLATVDMDAPLEGTAEASLPPEERKRRKDDLQQFLNKALQASGFDDNDGLEPFLGPFGGLKEEEYLRDLPPEVRRQPPPDLQKQQQEQQEEANAGSSSSSKSSSGQAMETLDETASSSTTSATASVAEKLRAQREKKEELDASKARQAAEVLSSASSGSSSLLTEPDPKAVAEFEAYVKSLAPDVREGVRALQTLGVIRTDGTATSQADGEYYRAYLELLSGTVEPAKATPAARVAAAQAVIAITGTKRKREEEAPGGSAAAAPSLGKSTTEGSGAGGSSGGKNKEQEQAILDSLS